MSRRCARAATKQTTAFLEALHCSALRDVAGRTCRAEFGDSIPLEASGA